MKTKLLSTITSAVLIGVAPAFFSACASSSETADLTKQDLTVATQFFVDDLFQCGKLSELAAEYPDESPMMEMRPIENATHQVVYTDQLSYGIVSVLVANGYVNAMSSDKNAWEHYRVSYKQDHGKNPPVDMLLSGSIRETSTRVGDTEQCDYNISVTITKLGKVFWTAEYNISKTREY
ncbi:MAG: hypothetical protein LUD52_04430 [Opitutae bacterium]|nr:hypothetical protein [Opitutae bacterium]